VCTPTAAWQAPGPRVTMQMQSLGHISCAGFVTGIHELDAVARIEQGVEHFQITLARHAKRHVGAVNEQLIDQQLAAGTCIGKRDRHGVSQVDCEGLS